MVNLKAFLESLFEIQNTITSFFMLVNVFTGIRSVIDSSLTGCPLNDMQVCCSGCDSDDESDEERKDFLHGRFLLFGLHIWL
jgi:hypothetical protein